MELNVSIEYMEEMIVEYFILYIKVIKYLRNIRVGFDFYFQNSILVNAVLGGEVAVSCNSQSALARLNPFSEAVYM